MPRITIQEPGKTPQPYRFDLNTPSVYLGRAESNQIVLECGSISGRHAVMMRIPGGFELRDLGSTNGIQKNDSSVETCFLRHGDQLMLGDVAFTFELSEEETVALEAEVSGVMQPDEPAVRERNKVSTEDKEWRREEPSSARRGVPGWCVFLAFLLFGSMAFFLGASLRHKNATGTSYVEMIHKRLSTPDINRIRDLTGEDPEEVFAASEPEPAAPVVVVEEVPEELEGWEDREHQEEGAEDSASADDRGDSESVEAVDPFAFDASPAPPPAFPEEGVEIDGEE